MDRCPHPRFCSPQEWNECIVAGSIAATATDNSTITATTGAASLAGAFGGTGVAIAIGIAVAQNSIIDYPPFADALIRFRSFLND